VTGDQRTLGRQPEAAQGLEMTVIWVMLILIRVNIVFINKIKLDNPVLRSTPQTSK
jgi:hypothetical protein